MSLRWAYSHMISEYCRRNGHADLLRHVSRHHRRLNPPLTSDFAAVGVIVPAEPACRRMVAVSPVPPVRVGELYLGVGGQAEWRRSPWAVRIFAAGR
jgi:hypothetical protein